MLKNKDNWPEEIIFSIANGKQYRSLLNKCIGHMPQKKLYKYYSFDSLFTLENIKNDTIYLSNPVDFNDPLDCNIGISPDFVIRMLLPTISGIDKNSEYYDLLNSMLFDIAEDEIDKDTKEAAVAECMKYPQFAKLIEQQQNVKKIDDALIAEAFMECPEILPKLVSFAYPDKLSSNEELDAQKLLKFLSASPIALKNLFGCISDMDAEQKQMLNVLTKDEDALRKAIELAEYMNLPIDKSKIEEFYSGLNEVVNRIHSSLGKTFGISCFTCSPFNMLMWSHYANKHTGICVEYDFGKLFSGEQTTLLFPVNYSTRRPLLSIDKIVNYDSNNLSMDESKLNILLPDIMKTLISKSDVWQYENEWRLIKSVKSNSERIIHLPLISKIYTGTNISKENLNSISEIAKNKDIPLVQCTLKSDKYEIIRKV